MVRGAISRLSRRPRNPVEPSALRQWLTGGLHGRVLRGTRELVRSPSHRQFVRQCYRAVLNREPDEVGRRVHVGALRRGEVRREDVLRTLASSPESARLTLKSTGIRELVADFSAARTAVDADLRPICFFHIMKTGGTAFARSLQDLVPTWPRLLDLWPDQLLCYPRPMLARAMLVTGHLPLDVRALLAPDVLACTVLREPVARTLSHFTHVRTHGRQIDLTLEEFVHEERWRRVWVDHQARWLATEVPALDVWSGPSGGLPDGAPAERFISPLQELQEANDPYQAPDLAARASERLATIELVGVNDDLHGLLVGVARLWRLPPPPPPDRVNEGLLTVEGADLTEALRAEIEAGTRVDAELYAMARARAEALPSA